MANNLFMQKLLRKIECSFFSALVSLLLIAATLSSVRAQTKPNIVFCIWDDASYPHQSINGCTWVNSPTFDRIAREGINFQNAYTTNAKSGPSRSCILTGRYSWQLEDMANHWATWPAKFKSYPEALNNNGYYVGATGKRWEPGCAGSAYTTGPAFNGATITPPTTQISNIDYAGNFTRFFNSKPANSPFCFWVGGREPHRGYEYQSGVKKGGKTLSAAQVPGYWPDNAAVRNDILDYAMEVEWFDTQVGKILTFLEQKNQLNNTIICFTSDNGMPFPRCKGQAYEFSNHLPLAIMWKNGIKSPGRIVSDYVNFIDFAPTFLDVAGISQAASQMQPISGRSLTDIFYSDSSGQVNPARNFVIIGRERNDVGRPNNGGYPVRAIIKDGYFYCFNFNPDRWPASNPETGYTDVDGSPTKTECIQARFNAATFKYWQWSFGKRDSAELYQLTSDKDCLTNLIKNPAYAAIAADLRATLFQELTKQNDPRMSGNGAVFDAYANCNFPPNWYDLAVSGKTVDMSWINKSDIDSAVIVPPTQVIMTDDDGKEALVSMSRDMVITYRRHGIAVACKNNEYISSVSLFSMSGALVASVHSFPQSHLYIDYGSIGNPRSGIYVILAKTGKGVSMIKAAIGTNYAAP